jgi:hypothetical protein
VTKIVLPLALLILVIAFALVSIQYGRMLERGKIKRSGGHIDPDTYAELSNLARALVAPPATIDDIVVLPEDLKEETERLVAKIGTARRGVR